MLYQKYASLVLILFLCLGANSASFDDEISVDADKAEIYQGNARTFSTPFERKENFHHRRKRRKKGDTFSELKSKLMARDFTKFLQKRQKNTDTDNGLLQTLKRRKRYQYDEDYDWENGGLDYEDRLEPKRDETKFEKWAKHWQKNALKFIFLFSFVMMILCCCCACCKKLCVKTKDTICFHIREWRDLCLCRDPTYRRMRHMADEYGFELDYSMYKQIKNNYEKGLENAGYGKLDLSGRT